jgi:signal transduction histidine kinase
MKRSLKMISPAQESSKQQLGESRKKFISRNVISEQEIAQIEKNQSTLNTLNELARTISHYLNSPLTVLLGKVDLLAQMNENGGVSKDELRKFLEASKREILRIDAIVKAFQDIYQVQHKTYPPGVKMLDVEREIKDRMKDTCFLR